MKRLFIFTLTVISAFAATAQENIVPKITAGPYIYACSQSEFTVIWQTDTNAVCRVEIAPDDGTHFYNTARKSYYHTIHGRRNIGTLHTVRITGLEPGTTYRYRIFHKGVIPTPYGIKYSHSRGSDVYKRQPYFIRTLDTNTDTTRFAVGNDFHDKPELLSQLFSKKIINAENYDFVLYNGDMVSNFESEQRMVNSVITPSVEQFATDVPLFFARGNHETRGAGALNFSDYFPTQTTTPYYTFSDGPAFFIVLDGGEDKPDNDIEYMDLIRADDYRKEQAKWLKEVVESDECKNAAVKIVFIHIPPKSNGWHGEAEISQLFAPILNTAGIDAMFCGHIHKYRFTEANDAFSGCNFPIICNPNRTRMDVEVNKEKITYKITNAENKEIITNEILIK